MDVSTAAPPEGINAGGNHHARKVLGEVSPRNWIPLGFSSAPTERAACKSGGDVNAKCQVADEAAVI